MSEHCGRLVSLLLLKDKIKHLPKYIIHNETFHWFCTLDTLRPIFSGSITAAAKLPRGKGYLQSVGTTLLWRWAGFWNLPCILENWENSPVCFISKDSRELQWIFFFLWFCYPGTSGYMTYFFYPPFLKTNK